MIGAVLALVIVVGATTAIVVGTMSGSADPHVQPAAQPAAPTKTVVTVVQKVTAPKNSTTPTTPTASGASSAAAKLPPLVHYSPGAYQVLVPATWTRTADDVDHGSYRESKWQSPNGDGSFLVDYTVGFTGTPRSGATTVRSSTSRSAGYQELGFEAWDNGRWRWDFALAGQRKTDVFTVGCGTGYATLGAASHARFQRLAPMFERMARSLIPQCE